MVKCPNCRSGNTQAGLDKTQCTDCGAVFDVNGNVEPVRGPFIVGNLADLQRGGAQAAAGGAGSTGDEVTAVGPALAVNMGAADEPGDPDDPDFGSIVPRKATHAHKK